MQIHVLSTTAKVTASKGNVSEMIDLSKNTVKLLESCKCPKTVPDMISDGDLHHYSVSYLTSPKLHLVVSLRTRDSTI